MSIVDIINAINDQAECDGAWVGEFLIVQKHKISGKKQESDIEFFDHEFVDQSCGISGDDYSGYVYYPVDNENYLRVSYSI